MIEAGPKTELLTINTNDDKLNGFEDNYNTSCGFFGVSLDHEAPIPICDAIAFLRIHGISQQGLFRTPGNLARVKELMEIYNKKFKKTGTKIDPHFSVLNEIDDIKPNDVASLLKKFFNELTEPLIPQKFKTLMMYIIKAEMPDKEKRSELHEILESVPSPNKEVAGFVLQFLRDMLEHQETTKMDAKNLGMCLAVCFFRGINSAEQIMLSTFGTLIIETLLSSDKPYPQPKAILVLKNTLFDESYVSTTLPEGSTRGSSIFGSFRNSALVKTILGSQKNQNKVLRSILEDVPIKPSGKTNVTRNSKDNDASSFNGLKDNRSQGSNELKKIDDLENLESSTNLIPKRKNSHASTTKNMKNMKIQIVGVKESDTLLELREKNKSSPALPPENLAPLKKKGKKPKNKNKKLSAVSSADSSALFTPILPKAASNNRLKKLDPATVESLDAGKSGDEEDMMLRVSNFNSAATSTRESFMGMRFSPEEAEQIKEERRKKRKHRKHRNRSAESEGAMDLNIAPVRALPPTPPSKPILNGNPEENGFLSQAESLEQSINDEI